MKKIVLSLAVVGLFLAGCSPEDKSQAAQAKQEMPPMPVKAFEVKLQDLIFAKTYPALLKPFDEVAVVARINGVLEKENFKEGSYVKKGAVLYEIQKNEYRATLDSAKAMRAQAQANFDKVEKDFVRGKYLFKNKAISQQQYDALLYAYDDAKATLQGSKATVAKAQIEYDYTTIKAPISGQIGISSSDAGAYISTPNATLTTITALDPVYAEFSLPNNDVLKYRSQIKVGGEVSISSGGKAYTGLVDYIAPKLDAQTDTLLVRATFKNRDKDLVIGSFMEIKLDGFNFQNVAIIPEYSLIRTPDAVLVYVIQKDGTIVMSPVEIAFVKDGKAIVTSGLKEGDKLVASNMAKLRPTSKVSIIGGK